jgi:hypothetical protein
LLFTILVALGIIRRKYLDAGESQNDGFCGDNVTVPESTTSMLCGEEARGVVSDHKAPIQH